ncbi:MAG: TldD/PmbA family protein [Gemmatimonadales bacterium]|nr:TldD/PmbA family protein [Gemmatimonadales bacterium]
MILPLLERAARRAALADAVHKTDETTTVTFVDGCPVGARTTLYQGVNLRVVSEGRAGTAGSVVEDPDDLLDRALASAALGEPTSLSLPRQAALPSVVTHVPRAAAATLAELADLGHLVRDRLGSERVNLGLTIERSLGQVRVANTAGLDAEYDVSLVVFAVQAARQQEGRRLVVEAALAGADLPSLTDLELLVAMLRQRFAWAERNAEAPMGRQRVGFLPTALPPLLAAVEQALVGKAALHGGSPLARQRGARAYSELLTLVDDPLLDGRPGSRPLDDEGVTSRRLPLVEAGQVAGIIYDLETAGRVGATPTGHGRRSTFAKPQAACTNLVLEAGAASWDDILATIGDGLVVEQLRPGTHADMMGGTFALPAALAWRVQGGEIVGLVPEVTVAGNVHDLLARLLAVGRDLMWVGSRAMPPVVVDGVSVF